LNFACPAAKVLRRGRGGALLSEPTLAIEIMKRVRDSVNCPVTVKLRIGRGTAESSKENLYQILTGAKEAGIDVVTVHGRTVAENYRGEADWDYVGRIKKDFKDMTIIGSGDLFTVDEVVRVINKTAVDGVLIARGAIGNPWIFSELRAYFQNKTEPKPPNISEQKRVILHHFELVRDIYPGVKAVRYFRKFLAGYCKRRPNRKAVLLSLIEAKSCDEFVKRLNRWYK
jgi:nifR3 family TIM-barrel protein